MWSLNASSWLTSLFCSPFLVKLHRYSSIFGHSAKTSSTHRLPSIVVLPAPGELSTSSALNSGWNQLTRALQSMNTARYRVYSLVVLVGIGCRWKCVWKPWILEISSVPREDSFHKTNAEEQRHFSKYPVNYCKVLGSTGIHDENQRNLSQSVQLHLEKEQNRRNFRHQTLGEVKAFALT